MNNIFSTKQSKKIKQLFTAVFLFLVVSGMTSCKKDPILQDKIEEPEKPILDENIEAVIPHIYIDVEGGQDVISKEDYLKADVRVDGNRSEEHTSELQSLMRISYAVLCLKKKNN